MLGMSLGLGLGLDSVGAVGARFFLRVDSVGMDSVEMMGWGMSLGLGLGRIRFLCQ